MKLNDQIVLVTGGNRGLGAEIVRSFVREGAKVIINYYQNVAQAERLEKELRESGGNVIAIQGDIRERDSMDRLFATAKAHFGAPITTIVNNALVNFKFDPINRKDAEIIHWQDFLKQLEGAVQGSLNTIQAGLTEMKQIGFGRIINIGTNLVQNPVVAYHDYNTAKSALLSFTRNMAKDLGSFGININMVSGGLLQTTDASAATSEAVFEIIKQNTPLGKVTTPAEVADTVLYFASPWSRGVTGQNIMVDGGLVMN